MRAVLLAAGLGSRLAAVTGGEPKSLVPVNGEPILLRSIRHLQEAGIAQIIVVAGYKAERIKAVLPANVQVVVNERYAETNSVYSLACAAPLLQGDAFLMQNADVLYSVGLLKRFLIHPSQNACLVDADRPYSLDEYRIAVNHQGRIVQYAKGLPAEQTVGESAQLLKVGQSDASAFLARIEDIAFSERSNGFPLQAYPVLQQGQGLYPVYTAKLPWWEIDKPEDLRNCEATYEAELLRVRPKRAVKKPLPLTAFVRGLWELLRQRKLPWRAQQTLVALQALQYQPLLTCRWYRPLWQQTLQVPGFKLQVFGPEVLQTVLKVAQQVGASPMAGWGTLLGAVRNTKLIVGDHDIDLLLLEKESHTLPLIKEALLQRGYQVRIDTPLKLSMVHGASKGLFFDIDVVKDEGEWYTIINDFADDQTDFHYRFSRRVFDGEPSCWRIGEQVVLLGPAAAEQFLDEVYGDWHKPAEKVDYRYGPLNVHPVKKPLSIAGLR